MILFFIRLISLISLSQFSSSAWAKAEFSSEGEADVHYKKQLPIYLQHDFGDVTIQGWNQDLIRVKFKKSTTAESEAIASDLFKKFDLISLETPTSIELRVGTPPGTDLLTKLRNRQDKKNIKVDLEIKAPATMNLTLVLGADIKLKLTQWKGKVDISGKQNTVELGKLKLSEPLHMNCPGCSLSLVDSELSGSILVSDQKIEIKKTKATPHALLLSAEKADISLEETQGDYQIRTQSGSVSSLVHQGNLQIQTDSGKVKLNSISGDLDVLTQSGSIFVDVKDVKNQLQMKNRDGLIDIELPYTFEGDVSLQSLKGEVSTDFLVVRNKNKMQDLYGPELKGRLIGSIGRSNVNLIAFSENGKILMKQKEMAK